MILAGGNSSKMKSWRIALRRLWLDESQDKPVENFEAGNTTVEKYMQSKESFLWCGDIGVDFFAAVNFFYL